MITIQLLSKTNTIGTRYYTIKHKIGLIIVFRKVFPVSIQAQISFELIRRLYRLYRKTLTDWARDVDAIIPIKTASSPAQGLDQFGAGLVVPVFVDIGGVKEAASAHLEKAPIFAPCDFADGESAHI